MPPSGNEQIGRLSLPKPGPKFASDQQVVVQWFIASEVYSIFLQFPARDFQSSNCGMNFFKLFTTTRCWNRGEAGMSRSSGGCHIYLPDFLLKLPLTVTVKENNWDWNLSLRSKDPRYWVCTSNMSSSLKPAHLPRFSCQTHFSVLQQCCSGKSFELTCH